MKRYTRQFQVGPFLVYDEAPLTAQAPHKHSEFEYDVIAWCSLLFLAADCHVSIQLIYAHILAT